MGSATTDRVYARLPAYIRSADVNQDLYNYLSLVCDQLDEVAGRLEAIAYYPLDDGGLPGDTSALVDATQAGLLGNATAHLKWLAQLVGVRLNAADSLQAQIDAVRYASSGWRAGTKSALADAARTVLTGTKFVRVEPHYAGDPLAINIRTRSSETPSAGAVYRAIRAKGAKPAGIVLLNEFFTTSWDTLETERPVWDDWNGSPWIDIEETGAPAPDSGNIPDPDPPDEGPGVTAPFFVTGTFPSNQGILQLTYGSEDIDLGNGVSVVFSETDIDLSTADIEMQRADGTPVVVEETDLNTFNNILIINPPADIGVVHNGLPNWEDGTTYNVTIKGGYTGLKTGAGHELLGDYEFEFTTEHLPTELAVDSVQWTFNESSGFESGGFASIVVVFNMPLDEGDFDVADFTVTSAVTGAAAPFVNANIVGPSEGPTLGPPHRSVVVSAGVSPGSRYRLSVEGSGVAGVKGYDGSFLAVDFTDEYTTSGQPPVAQPVDPPTVVSTSPNNDQIGVLPSQEVAVRFNRAMDATTFTSSSVKLRKVGGTQIPATITYDSSRFRISIAPGQPNAYSTDYELELTTAIKDVNGTALASPYIYDWRTAAAPPTPVDPSPVEGNYQLYWMDDFKAPLDYVNAWWKPYHGPSTWNAGTFDNRQIKLDTSGTGILTIEGVVDPARRNAKAVTDSISGGIAAGLKAINAPGAFEVRRRIDRGKGFGEATMGWCTSNRWPDDSEIDMMETPKGDRWSGLVNYHYKDPGGVHRQTGKGLPIASIPALANIDLSQWHVVRAEWEVGRVTYYVDGIKVHEILGTDKVETGSKMHIALQLDIGKPGMGWIDVRDSSTPAVVRYQVDWVKVYKKV